MSAQHTPGPWTIEEYGDEECPALVVHKDGASRVCFMATPGSHGDLAIIKADARLIAAAPELMEALSRLVADFEEARPHFVGHPLCVRSSSIDNAKAAIAKAEGRS